jgi:hypothetical protein
LTHNSLFCIFNPSPIEFLSSVYAELFDDIVHILGGKHVGKQFEPDISVVLYPLPKVPVMICYWLPEESLDSSLYLFLDQATDQNPELLFFQTRNKAGPDVHQDCLTARL